MKIKSIDAFQIYDSRGNPTIEAVVTLENGVCGHGLVPSGASTGQFEALELRDKDPAKFLGKSVFKAIGHIRGEIAKALLGHDVSDQRGLDEAMIQLDGTAGKSRLGANAILGVSMAAANAAANAKGIPLYQSLGNGTLLPLPEIQILGGGAHANWRTDVQDFLVIATGAQSYEETLEITFNVFHAAGQIMKKRGHLFGCADEGGYWPEFKTNEEALATFNEAVELPGYTPGREASLSLDIAASDLYDPATNTYRFALEDRTFTSDEFIDLMVSWCRKYSVVSIEDPAADTDWNGWERFHNACGSTVQIIGDDLFTTNAEPDPRGHFTGSRQFGPDQTQPDRNRHRDARCDPPYPGGGLAARRSARSGETEDAFISHLAVATNAGQLKVGSFSRSERMAKWNECLRIGRHLGPRARFEGRSVLVCPHGDLQKA